MAIVKKIKAAVKRFHKANVNQKTREKMAVIREKINKSTGGKTTADRKFAAQRAFDIVNKSALTKATTDKLKKKLKKKK